MLFFIDQWQVVITKALLVEKAYSNR